MPLDSSSSHSIADETNCFQIIENNEFSKDRFSAGPGCETGSVVEACVETKGGCEKITVGKMVCRSFLIGLSKEFLLPIEGSFIIYRRIFYRLSKEFTQVGTPVFTNRTTRRKWRGIRV